MTSRNDHGVGGPVAAHRGLRRRRPDNCAAVARTGGVSTAGGPGPRCLLRRDVRGSDRHDLAVRARRRNVATGSSVRMHRAMVRASEPGRLRPGPAAQPASLLDTLMAGAMIWM